jgi:hypothetical protein
MSDLWTLIDGAAGITAGCTAYGTGYLIIKGIRASARFAVATWREITPEPHVSELIATAVVRRLRRIGTS